MRLVITKYLHNILFGSAHRQPRARKVVIAATRPRRQEVTFLAQDVLDTEHLAGLNLLNKAQVPITDPHYTEEKQRHQGVR